MRYHDSQRAGFTIVELLIVVVVIAILAAITIVAYSGIRDRTNASAVASTLSQLSRKVKSYAVSHAEMYPDSLSDAGVANNSDYFYSSNNATSPRTFCITFTQNSKSYFVTHATTSPTPGSCQGLVAWWPMNGNANDIAGPAGGQAVSDAALTVGQNGKADDAYSFPTTSARIQMNDGWGSSYNFNQISSTAWVRPTTTGGTQGVFWSSGSPLHWEIISGQWRVRAAGIDVKNFAPAPPVNEWTHIAFTYNRTSGTFTYYVNGQQVYTVAAGDSGTNSFFVVSGGSTGEVGASLNGTSRSWSGSLDDIRIYNRELSGAEVARLYAEGAQ